MDFCAFFAANLFRPIKAYRDAESRDAASIAAVRTAADNTTFAADRGWGNRDAANIADCRAVASRAAASIAADRDEGSMAPACRAAAAGRGAENKRGSRRPTARRSRPDAVHLPILAG